MNTPSQCEALLPETPGDRERADHNAARATDFHCTPQGYR